MIRFDLICDQDHQFDSWFASNAAFESLQKAGMLSCLHCGSKTVRKSLMAPKVQTTNAAMPPKPEAPLAPADPDTATQLAKMRKDVETNSDYVGLSFASEARAMHEGTMPERSIYGEANGTEARKLLQDGIPVMPLPFIPTKKSN
jgi:hypothetical protein